MNPSLFLQCQSCKEFGSVEAAEGHFSCPNCAQHLVKIADINTILDQCPICECNQFYLSKNFNQFLGCLIMAFGIVLVPLTYGLSLPVFALIDWLLYKRVKSIVCCYKCGCEFHDFKPKSSLKPFMHHIGLKYDKHRS